MLLLCCQIPSCLAACCEQTLGLLVALPAQEHTESAKHAVQNVLSMHTAPEEASAEHYLPTCCTCCS